MKNDDAMRTAVIVKAPDQVRSQRSEVRGK
jgi:hypothetical protein